MAHDFSFSTRQWWVAIACSILVLVLVFAAGFVGGVIWNRSRAVSAPASAKAPAS